MLDNNFQRKIIKGPFGVKDYAIDVYFINNDFYYKVLDKNIYRWEPGNSLNTLLVESFQPNQYILVNRNSNDYLLLKFIFENTSDFIVFFDKNSYLSPIDNWSFGNYFFSTDRTDNKNFFIPIRSFENKAFFENYLVNREVNTELLNLKEIELFFKISDNNLLKPKYLKNGRNSFILLDLTQNLFYFERSKIKLIRTLLDKFSIDESKLEKIYLMFNYDFIYWTGNLWLSFCNYMIDNYDGFYLDGNQINWTKKLESYFSNPKLSYYRINSNFETNLDENIKKFLENLIKTYKITDESNVIHLTFTSEEAVELVKNNSVKNYSQLWEKLGPRGYILYTKSIGSSKSFSLDGKSKLLRIKPISEINYEANVYKSLNPRDFRCFCFEKEYFFKRFVWLRYLKSENRLYLRYPEFTLESLPITRFHFSFFDGNFISIDITETFWFVFIQKVIKDFLLGSFEEVELFCSLRNNDIYFWRGDSIPETFNYKRSYNISGEWIILTGDGKYSIEYAIPEHELTIPECFYLKTRFRNYLWIKTDLARSYYRIRTYENFGLGSKTFTLAPDDSSSFVEWIFYNSENSRKKLPNEFSNTNDFVINMENPFEQYGWVGDEIPDDYDPKIHRIYGQWIPIQDFISDFYFYPPSNAREIDDTFNDVPSIDVYGKLIKDTNLTTNQLNHFAFFQTCNRYNYPRDPSQIRKFLNENMDKKFCKSLTIRDFLNSDTYFYNRITNFKYSQLDSNDTREYSVLIRIFNPDLKEYETGDNWKPDVRSPGRFLYFTKLKLYYDSYSGLCFDEKTKSLSTSCPKIDWDHLNQINLEELNAEWRDYVPVHDPFYNLNISRNYNYDYLPLDVSIEQNIVNANPSEFTNPKPLFFEKFNNLNAVFRDNHHFSVENFSLSNDFTDSEIQINDNNIIFFQFFVDYNNELNYNILYYQEILNDYLLFTEKPIEKYLNGVPGARLDDLKYLITYDYQKIQIFPKKLTDYLENELDSIKSEFNKSDQNTHREVKLTFGFDVKTNTLYRVLLQDEELKHLPLFKNFSFRFILGFEGSEQLRNNNDDN